jgi:selT/selW/selH-like putative selenoprotein
VEAELKSRYSGLKIELKRGSGGIFDVIKDGKLIYSKANENRFPRDGEIAELVGNK